MDYVYLDNFLLQDEVGVEVEEEKSKKAVEALHKILRPFWLRRVKTGRRTQLLMRSRVFYN